MRIENVSSFHKIPNAIKNSGNRCLSNIDSLQFENVCFKYPLASKSALHEFNLKIVKGEKIAIVGVNGAGKSTLVKILLRFYEPNSGTIKINGIDYKEYTLESLRQSVSCYFQNEPNFAFTIRENIVISDILKEATDTEVSVALKKAQFEKVIYRSKGNINSYVTKLFDAKGLELSGGEHQRLALARVFYRECHILLLDEPSSSLDPEAEKQIFDNLKKSGEGRIVIFTSHKLSNLALANKIIVVENGTIIEAGTKDMLMEQKGRFFELFHYQQPTRVDNKNGEGYQ